MYKKITYLAVSLLLVSAACSVVQADLDGWEAAIGEANPLHWYKFDETGSECVDAGSGGLNGAYNGVTLGQEGRFTAGTAARFTRSEGNVVDFAGATDLATPWTVEYIIKTVKPPAAQEPQALHDSGTTSVRLAGWTALGEAGFTLYGVADYRFTPAGDNTLNDLVIPQDKWIHIVWRSDTAGGMQLFIDGVLMGTSTDSIELGRLRLGSHGAVTNALDGVLDEAVVFDRLLTDAEIFDHASNTFPVKATNPFPQDGVLYMDTWVSLTWTAGSTAASHDVYLSDNFDEANDGTGDAFRGNQGATYFVAGFPGFPYPDGLVPGTTYYWRVDEVEADGVTKHKGDIWSFLVPAKTAYDPSPADGAEFIALDATLSWTGGFGSKLHTVYFGNNFDEINNAAGNLPQTEAEYNPGPLEKGMTYYWRVDEFDGVTTYKGDVWSFSTITDIPISNPNLMGWWSLDEGTGDVAVDWSGHDNHGQLEGGPLWVEGRVGGALEFDGNNWIDCGDALTMTDALTITCWVNPAGLSGDNGWVTRQASYAFKSNSDHLRFTTPGILDHDAFNAILQVGTWQHVAVTFEPDQVGGAAFFINGVELDRMDASSMSAGSGPFRIANNQWNQYYEGMIDDVRVYDKILTAEEITQTMRGDPLVAWGPSPANGSTPDIDQALPLSWSPGDNASQHDVYFGTDENAVANADTSTADIYRGRQSATSYTPPEGVEWGGGPYYWRVDEVNTDGTISKGGLWSFTVADFILVDDFESYTDNDIDGESIWQHWIDGFGIAGNGAQVGYLLPPYAERAIVNNGNQSMPFFYDNIAGVSNSEAVLTLAAPRDWTRNGLTDLSLWFRGYPASTGSFVEAPAGTFTMTGSGADIWGTADQFHYAFKTLTGTGTIITRVNSLQNTSGWAKAGVMIRETLDPGSKHAFGCVTPANGVAFQGRIDTDATSFNTNEAGLTAPYWVKLERDVLGNFTVTHSANGTSWSQISGAAPRNISMSSTVYIGLAVCSTSAAATCQAVFSNVTTTGNVSGQWAHQDIGIANNAAEPMYVAISNKTGAPAVVANEDPAAATIDTWSEWPIPLQAFADQGVNLADVDRIAIGLGSNAGMASAGGTGTMYFDDIRLYRSAP